MKVSDCCVRKVEVVGPRRSVSEAARQMKEAAVGTLIVVDELGRPLGIVTDRDLVLRFLADSGDPSRTPVERVMSGPVAWIHEETTLESALEEMTRLRVRRLVVVDGRERLVGLVALDDALMRELGPESPLGQVLRATS
jgi:CBS domain-containing protein